MTWRGAAERAEPTNTAGKTTSDGHGHGTQDPPWQGRAWPHYLVWKSRDGLRTTRSTADPYNLRVKHGRLDPRRNFFRIRVIEDWNRIPAEVKRVDNSESFKATYRTQRATQIDHAARWESWTRVQGPDPDTSGETIVRAGQPLPPHTDESSTRLHGGLDSTLQVTSK